MFDEFGRESRRGFPKAVTEEMIRNATVVVSLKRDLELPHRVVGPRYEVWGASSTQMAMDSTGRVRPVSRSGFV